jgi:hypothetical protein
MNIASSEVSHTIVMEQPSIHSIHNQTLSQLDHMMQQPTVSPTLQIGENDANLTSQNSDQNSPHRNVTKSVKTLPNLQSPAKPHEILEKQLEPKILKVSKQDIQAITQMILEYQEILKY